MSDVALIHRLCHCLPATIQISVALMKGGTAPERITEWYEALHLIDQNQVTSAAILDSVPAANQSIQVPVIEMMQAMSLIAGQRLTEKKGRQLTGRGLLLRLSVK